MKKPRWTDAEKNAVTKMYKEGVSRSEIAEITGRTYRSINSFIFYTAESSQRYIIDARAATRKKNAEIKLLKTQAADEKYKLKETARQAKITEREKRLQSENEFRQKMIAERDYKEERRQKCYDDGLTDKQGAEKCGEHYATYRAWRIARGLEVIYEKEMLGDDKPPEGTRRVFCEADMVHYHRNINKVTPHNFPAECKIIACASRPTTEIVTDLSNRFAARKAAVDAERSKYTKRELNNLSYINMRAGQAW